MSNIDFVNMHRYQAIEKIVYQKVKEWKPTTIVELGHGSGALTVAASIALKEINSKLWVIEDDKRDCEKHKDFGEKFIKLSRDVHFLNDDRAKIKLEINNHTSSVIKEIKEYTKY